MYWESDFMILLVVSLMGKNRSIGAIKVFCYFRFSFSIESTVKNIRRDLKFLPNTWLVLPSARIKGWGGCGGNGVPIFFLQNIL